MKQKDKEKRGREAVGCRQLEEERKKKEWEVGKKEILHWPEKGLVFSD